MSAFIAFLMSPAFLSAAGSVAVTVLPIVAHANGWNLGWLSNLLSAAGIAPAVSPAVAPTPASSGSIIVQAVQELFALFDEVPAVVPLPVTPVVPGAPVTPVAPATGPLRGLIRGLLAKQHSLPVGSTALESLTNARMTQLAAALTPTVPA